MQLRSRDGVLDALALVVQIDSADRLEKDKGRRRSARTPQLWEIDKNRDQPTGRHSVKAEGHAKRLGFQAGRLPVRTDNEAKLGIVLPPKKTDGPEACHEGSVIRVQPEHAELGAHRTRLRDLDHDLADALSVVFSRVPSHVPDVHSIPTRPQTYAKCRRRRQCAEAGFRSVNTLSARLTTATGRTGGIVDEPCEPCLSVGGCLHAHC